MTRVFERDTSGVRLTRRSALLALAATAGGAILGRVGLHKRDEPALAATTNFTGNDIQIDTAGVTWIPSR